MFGGRGTLRNVAIVAVGASVAVASGANALANYLAAKRPALAAKIWPTHAQALQIWNDQLLLTGRSGFQFRASPINARLSQTALANAAIAPGALRTAALLANQRGDRSRGYRLLLATNRLTRRDYITQLLLMEAAVRRRDLDGALAALSPVLRTSQDARTTLVPVFTALISLDASVNPMRRQIRQRPNWLLPMLGSSIGQSPDPRPLARAIIAENGLANSDLERSVTQQLSYRLVALGHVPTAMQVIATLPARYRPSVSSLAVSASRDDAFAWTITPSAEFTGAADDAQRSLDFDVSIAAADIARKLMVARGGALSSTVQLELDALEPDTAPVFQLIQNCARGSGSRVLVNRLLRIGRQQIPVNAQSGLGCDVQVVTIRLTDGMAGHRYNLRIRFD